MDQSEKDIAELLRSKDVDEAIELIVSGRLRCDITVRQLIDLLTDKMERVT